MLSNQNLSKPRDIFLFGPELFSTPQFELDAIAALTMREARESLFTEWEFFFVSLDLPHIRRMQDQIDAIGFPFVPLALFPPVPTKETYAEARKLLRLCRAAYSPIFEKAYRLSEVCATTGRRNSYAHFPAAKVRDAWSASHDTAVPYFFEELVS